MMKSLAVKLLQKALTDAPNNMSVVLTFNFQARVTLEHKAHIKTTIKLARLKLKVKTCKLQVTTFATCSQSQRTVQSMVSAH